MLPAAVGSLNRNSPSSFVLPAPVVSSLSRSLPSAFHLCLLCLLLLLLLLLLCDLLLLLPVGRIKSVKQLMPRTSDLSRAPAPLLTVQQDVELIVHCPGPVAARAQPRARPVNAAKCF